jgi:pseudouridine synthase
MHAGFFLRLLHSLQSGVVITTVAQRDRVQKPLTAKTKPCLVVRHRQVITTTQQDEPCGDDCDDDSCVVQITLYEGRNRQIRKMIAACGYEVVRLHRISFAGISLKPLVGPGSWQKIRGDELQMINAVLNESESYT